MEPYRKLLGTGAELVFVKDKPGRIAHEVAMGKSVVVAQMIAGITKAGMTLGLSNMTNIKETAEAAIKKVMEVYPSAYVLDVLKALEMASFGQIKVEGQLTNISAANIFNWYKAFRSDFGHLSVNPMIPIPNAMPLPTESEKENLVRDFFKKGIADPDSIDGGFDVIFKRVISLGLYSVNADFMEQKFRSELNRVSFAFKIQTVADQKKKGQLIKLQNMVNSEFKESKIDFAAIKANENLKQAFLLVSDTVKKEIVKEIMKTHSIDLVMGIYDKNQ